MDGYVFHCTPCGKPHAGECPPSIEKVKRQFKEAVDSANSNWKTPIFTTPVKMGWFVGLGTFWASESRDDPWKAWDPGNKQYYYEVTEIVVDDVELTPIEIATGKRSFTVINVHIDCFTDDGFDEDGTGDILRFVPYAP